MKIGVFILSLFWMTFLSCQQDQEREGVESIIFAQHQHYYWPKMRQR